jgi:hypothetical protein
MILAPFGAVRRGMCVETEAAKCRSSVGAACPHAAPDGAGEQSIGGQCYKHAAPTPLPTIRIRLFPPGEPKRIVARVEELLRWCDTLEAQWQQTRTLGAHFLASTLHHLLAA